MPDLLSTRRGRRGLFAALYFLEGAPIGFLWWALPPALRASGHPVDEISALVAVLALPWALKVLWAPLVDVLRGPRWTERGWITAAQAAMVACLLPLVVGGLEVSRTVLTVALVAHACAAATQDVAIDALAVRATSPEERGSVNAWMNAGMLCGRALFSAGALWARAALGDRAIVGLLVALLALGASLGLLYRPERPPFPGRARAAELWRHARAVARRATTWRLLAFAALGGAGFELVGALLGPFYLDLGGTQGALAWFYAVPAWAAPVAGGFLGGWLADRRGHAAGTALAGGALAAAILLLAALTAAADPTPLALLAALAVVYLGIGAFTAASYALFMDATDPALGSTQFSAYMGATNLCESWSAGGGGRLAARWGGESPGRGYAGAFALLAGVSLLALALLPRAVERSGGEGENQGRVRGR